MPFSAKYYDSISPRPKTVSVRVHNAQFVFKNSSAQDALTAEFKTYAIADCEIDAPLGDAQQIIELPDGGRLEADYQAFKACLPSGHGQGFWRALHFAENHKSIVFFALIGIIVSTLALLQYGVPFMAKVATTMVPAKQERLLGEQSLSSLDKTYFAESSLPTQRQNAIRQSLATVCAKIKDCPDYALSFRQGNMIGSNAFALPGGIVVVTDELVKLADYDDEIIAVLTHELGHVQKRHTLRKILQGTISGIMIVAVTGDLSTIAAGAPALLLNMQYSRDLETEADDFALTALQQACIPSKAFADILSKLSQQTKSGAAMPELLASHPDTAKRIKPFIKANATCL